MAQGQILVTNGDNYDDYVTLTDLNMAGSPVVLGWNRKRLNSTDRQMPATIEAWQRISDYEPGSPKVTEAPVSSSVATRNSRCGSWRKSSVRPPVVNNRVRKASSARWSNTPVGIARPSAA